jgi:hypothetical protein
MDCIHVTHNIMLQFAKFQNAEFYVMSRISRVWREAYLVVLCEFPHLMRTSTALTWFIQHPVYWSRVKFPDRVHSSHDAIFAKAHRFDLITSSAERKFYLALCYDDAEYVANCDSKHWDMMFMYKKKSYKALKVFAAQNDELPSSAMVFCVHADRKGCKILKKFQKFRSLCSQMLGIANVHSEDCIQTYLYMSRYVTFNDLSIFRMRLRFTAPKNDDYKDFLNARLFASTISTFD